MSILAERIQLRRKHLKMSQIDLAEALDMSQTQVSRYELGQNSPTADVLINLSQVLRVRAEWLLGLTDSMLLPATSTESVLSEVEREILEAVRLTDPTKQEELAEIFKRIVGLVVG